MSVITEVQIPGDEFQLGRILAVEDDIRITLETMVPIGGDAVPFFTVFNHAREEFEETVSTHPLVEEFHVVNEHEEETLYSLQWDVSQDRVFQSFRALGVQLLEATGGAERWGFELRFDSHTDLAAFQKFCNDEDISLVVERIYNPTRPDTGPWYGLTPKQRETLTLAFEEGYYSIPRETSTVALGARLGVSDQAVTERLRRGIHNLLENTLMSIAEADGDGR